jgi:hypothetical protein
MKVKIFSDFCDPTGNLGALKSWGKGTQYRNVEFVDGDDYTHAVLLNSVTPILNIDKKNILQFLWEPYELLDINKIAKYAESHKGYIVAHDRRLIGNHILYHIPYLSPLPLSSDHTKPKKNRMSIIASSKGYLNGHKLRHLIIQKILNSNLDIHIYGNGIKDVFRVNDTRIKGFIEHKPDALSEYEYTISIENTKYDYYLTEKFTDPIICGCVPLYWGANNVSSIFGSESHVDLPNSLNSDEIFEKIKDVYQNGSNKNPQIVYNRLKDDLNLPHYIWNHFNNVVK